MTSACHPTYAMPCTLNVNYVSATKIVVTYIDVDGITKTAKLCHSPKPARPQPG